MARITVVSYPSFSICSLSKLTRRSPAFTVSPSVIWVVKCFPSSLTVSIPMCKIISAPLSDFIVTACPVGNTEIIFPSAGANTFPSEGTKPEPLPMIHCAKVGSFTSFKAIVVPLTGDANCSEEAVLCVLGRSGAETLSSSSSFGSL